MAWDGLLVCMVQVLHVLQLFSHPGLPWLQTSCFFVSWRNAFLLSLIFSTLALHSYSLGTLVPARQVDKMQKTCSWAPFECIAGQKWQKPLWAAISEIYETSSPIMSNHKQSCIPKRLSPVRIQRLASATHSSPSPSIKTTSIQGVRGQPSLHPEDITCTTMPDTTDTPSDKEKNSLSFGVVVIFSCSWASSQWALTTWL